MKLQARNVCTVSFRLHQFKNFNIGSRTQHVKHPIEHRCAFRKAIGCSHMRHTEVKSRHDYAEGSICLMSNVSCSFLATSQHDWQKHVPYTNVASAAQGVVVTPHFVSHIQLLMVWYSPINQSKWRVGLKQVATLLSSLQHKRRYLV